MPYPIALQLQESSAPTQREPLRLLPLHALVKTSSIDHADWNYRPFLGAIQRLRFRFACELLGPERVGRMLEIGYGSGIFLPELDRRCSELHAVDIHGKRIAVAQSLSEMGVAPRLRCASATDLPYPDQHFDRVVAVSSLEFFVNLRRACREIRRVLAPGGRLVVVTPSGSAVADLGLRLLTGESAKNEFGDRRTGLVDLLLEEFDLEAKRVAPCLYTALSLSAPDASRPLRLQQSA